MKLICDIYKSPKDADMYLYVQKSEGLSRVPEALVERFGQPKHAMTLLLTPEKTLANADIHKVLQSLQEKGFYLQLPPPKEKYMQAVNQHNSKLAGV
ncbi:YcgL domain-containing protein [Marinibactrum halimedae]|uniref:YcgL domain-containing protein GCM10007877_20220 n=1 Tax=Marinibactrum halimedae TaxID=1444977 RepID=A0AA37TBY3_9GAMM|nr:YcgL domain-containing protein [Marinibactrum halimedae]MCD9457872.1 YcgL domain-containing protein [Marinibactrum halimedae]GLS26307.1 YcgL domain-containing protein [Marinibactrum halimedae]